MTSLGEKVSYPYNGENPIDLISELEISSNIRVVSYAIVEEYTSTKDRGLITGSYITLRYEEVFKPVETDIDPYSCIHAAGDSE